MITIKDYNASANNLLNNINHFTMSDMSAMSDLLHEVMSDIMSRTDNTLKYRHWRMRLIWKDMFNLVASKGFDNAYTENVFDIFRRGLSYKIDNMNEEETLVFIGTITKTMREI